MLVYDVIKNCDIVQAIRIYLDDWADESELMKKEQTALKLYDFWKMICGLTPVLQPGYILVALKGDHGDGKTTVAAELYKKDDFEDSLHIIRKKEFPACSSEDSLAALKNIDVSGWFPCCYDYEWRTWEDILGFTVLKGNIERNGADAVTAYIFYEMTFDGWIRETRDARIDGMVEKICGMIKKIEDDQREDSEESLDNDTWEDKGDMDEASENILEKAKTDYKKNMALEQLRYYEMVFQEFRMIYMDRERREKRKTTKEK